MTKELKKEKELVHKLPVYKGDLEGFPHQVVSKMLYYQAKQGNEMNVSVFEEDRTCGRDNEGFDWGKTEEGHDFWDKVIANKEFNEMTETYGVDIVDFPFEVVEMMLIRQFEQHGKFDISHFENNRQGGFVWENSPEGHEFWANVAEYKGFDLFYKRYPKEATITVSTPSENNELNGYYIVDKGLYAIVKRNIEKKVNTLLLGPTGVGKTELVSNIAAQLGLSLTIFDMGTMTDPIMSLIGNHTINMKDGVTTSSFIKSRFSQAIQQPGIILLDELSRANLTANNLLFPCLDFRRELPMEYAFDGQQPIKVHPECVFFATANLGGQYTGAHKLDRALIDRFMCIEMDPLSTQQTKRAIQLYCPFLTGEQVVEMVRVYDSINLEHDRFNISFNLSIRHLKMIADMVKDGFTMYDAYITLCKGIGGVEGKKAIEPILKTK